MSIQISGKLDWISVLCQPVLNNIDLWTCFALFWFLQKNNKPNWNNIIMDNCLFMYVCVCIWHYYFCNSYQSTTLPSANILVPCNADNIAMCWYGNALQA